MWNHTLLLLQHCFKKLFYSTQIVKLVKMNDTLFEMILKCF